MTATKSRRRLPGGSALTPKQKQVLAHLERGEAIPQVAKKLRITSSGVYGHIRKIKAAGVEIPEASTNGSDKPNTTAASTTSSATSNGATDIDIPTIIRAQIEVAQEAITGIDHEVEEMKARAERLGSMREAQMEQITRHESALSAYQQ